MKWRVTFVESGYSALASMCNFSPEGKAIAGIPNISSSPKMEVRGSNGAIIRVGSGGEFTLVDSPLGEQPQFYGEVFVSRENPAKYRTSCYIGHSPSSSTIDYFVKPIPNQDADKYFAIVGDLIIFEFDSNGKPYDIVSVTEGSSAVVAYTKNADGSHKYMAQAPKPIADTDYDYILQNYIDPRKWR
jgi:hypothetical protein